jgi:hypothetical protein
MQTLLNKPNALLSWAAVDFNLRPFTKRIKTRHRIFWTPRDAEEVRSRPIQQHEAVSEITKHPHWQRMLSNKANALCFANMMGCKLPHVYWQGKSINNINFDALPRQFVVKPTIGHSCNNVFLMDNGFNHMDKRYYSTEAIRASMAKVLEQNPRNEFLIEEFLRSETGEYRIPLDYKVHTFNGEIACIEVIDRKARNVCSENVFDAHWNKIENIGHKFTLGNNVEPPRCLGEIFEYAKMLSKVYGIYVRLDFYATDKGAVFGEFTPTPGIGVGFTRKANRMLTRYWDAYCKGMI